MKQAHNVFSSVELSFSVVLRKTFHLSKNVASGTVVTKLTRSIDILSHFTILSVHFSEQNINPLNVVGSVKFWLALDAVP